MTSGNGAVDRRVIQLVANAAGVAPAEIDVAADLSSLGMGSLERLECVLNIEDAFHVELDESDLRKLRTVGELVAAVRHAVSRQSSTS